ncbi:hypothetical protein PV327_010089 [Microctonus hyperodae]|uniref:Regulator of microtubule dynamics protein 1 n=1 Tax=Microctonus hyperodae TaxID=165561 RepID=A0AA39KGN1_MICHY|nr:hypothetical protein PV327_010089 [Microctonus hyperodae]
MFVQRFFRFVQSYRISQRARIIIYQTFKGPVNKYCTNKSLMNVPVISLSLWGIVKKNDSNDNSMTTKKLVAKIDALYDNKEYEKIHDISTKYKDSQDVEILWRHCRALYYMSKTASDVEGKKMIYEAYNLIMKAQSICDNHWAVHKWIAILLDSKSSYEGMKERLKQLYTVKQHMMEAIKLNPHDATTLYMLGNWCYSVSDLAWYQRKIASAIFGQVPTSTFEEALKYLEAAEEIDPMFYSQNLLLLAKTYLKLQRKDDAIKYLKIIGDFPARTDEDQKAKQEATKILGTI